MGGAIGNPSRKRRRPDEVDGRAAQTHSRSYGELPDDLAGVRCGEQAMRRPAFTLVELLVVISIIGLLIAIAVPALRAARAQGRLVQCATNLRQIGQGFGLYAFDANDTLPINDGEDWTTAGAWTKASEIVGLEITWVEAIQPSLGARRPPWLAPLRCPQSNSAPADPATIADVYERPGSGWLMNSYCLGRRQSTIRAPADGVLVLESAAWTSFSEDTGELELPTQPACYPHPSVAGPAVPVRWGWPYRRAKRNILWCDGHVASFRAAHWPDGDNAFDAARRRHMRFGLPGSHPLDP